MIWKSTEELCPITLKSDTKFKETLTLGSENDMMSLLRSTQKIFFMCKIIISYITLVTFWPAFVSFQKDFYYVHIDIDIFFSFFFNKTLTSFTCFFSLFAFTSCFSSKLFFLNNIYLAFFIYRKKCLVSLDVLKN